LFKISIFIFRKLQELELLERLAGDVLTKLIHHRIESHVQETCKGSFDTSYITALENVSAKRCEKLPFFSIFNSFFFFFNSKTVVANCGHGVAHAHIRGLLGRTIPTFNTSFSVKFKRYERFRAETKLLKNS